MANINTNNHCEVCLQTNKNLIKNINKFIVLFLENNVSEYITDVGSVIENLESKAVQTELKKVLSNKKTNKQKKKKNNNIKKNRTSYIFFCLEYRKKIKEEMEGISTTDITKELGKRWKMLKEDDSRRNEYNKFIKLAEQDKIRYQSEMDNIEQTVCVQESKQVASEQESEQVVSEQESEQVVSEQESEQVVDEQESKQLVDEQESKQVVDEQESKQVVDEQESKQVVSEQEKKGKKKQTTKKIKPFVNFSKKQRPILKERYPELKPKEITKLLSTEWKQLSKEEKEEYNI